MHEVVHLSFGANSNHLHSHFYNSQVSYFVYSEKETSPVDPHVLFRAGKGFTPRALIWELKGGFGGLSKASSVYEEDTDAAADISLWPRGESTIAQPRVPKSSYRQYMEGLSSDYDRPNTANTLYWSDYFKTLYHPRSLLTLNNWEYDPILYPNGKPKGQQLDAHNPNTTQTTLFQAFDLGAEEWNDLNHDNDYLELHLRPILEQCDHLDGLSVATDADSAWSAFTCRALEEVRDDYIPKGTIYTWASFSNDRLNAARFASRVKSTLSLIESSSLFIPYSTPANVKYPTSLWYTNALNNIFFESYSLLASLRAPCKRISMEALLDTVTAGSSRTVVDCITGSTDSSGYMDFTASLFDTKSLKTVQKGSGVFSASIVKRPSSSSDNSKSGSIVTGVVDTGKLDPWSLIATNSSALPNKDTSLTHLDRDKLLSEGVSEFDIHEFEYTVPSAVDETKPSDIFKSDETTYASFKTTRNAGRAFADLGELSAKVFKSDEREEIVQGLRHLCDVYEYVDSEDSDLD